MIVVEALDYCNQGVLAIADYSDLQKKFNSAAQVSKQNQLFNPIL